MDERTARELYLRCFQYIVEKEPPLAMMTSYNKVNGVHTASCYDLCTGICREEWGYEGLLMSDWYVQANASDCINAGNDLLMPGRDIPEELLLNGEIRYDCAVKSAARLLTLLEKTKTFIK